MTDPTARWSLVDQGIHYLHGGVFFVWGDIEMPGIYLTYWEIKGWYLVDHNANANIHELPKWFEIA
jgi:uncharacterized membrane protein YhdT